MIIPVLLILITANVYGGFAIVVITYALFFIGIPFAVLVYVLIFLWYLGPYLSGSSTKDKKEEGKAGARCMDID